MQASWDAFILVVLNLNCFFVPQECGSWVANFIRWLIKTWNTLWIDKAFPSLLLLPSLHSFLFPSPPLFFTSSSFYHSLSTSVSFSFIHISTIDMLKCSFLCVYICSIFKITCIGLAKWISGSKQLLVKPEDLSLILKIHVEGENWLPLQFVLWPGKMCFGVWQLPTRPSTHT